MDLIDIRDLSKPTSRLSFRSIGEKVRTERGEIDQIERTDQRSRAVHRSEGFMGLNANPADISDTIPKTRVTLLEFIRMYTIAKIPIMDFIIIYVIIYSLNCIYFDCDFKIVSVGTIPLTIFLNMIFNDSFVESIGVIAFFILSLTATIYMWMD